MRFHVLTLFPQMIEQGLSESITGRALKQNIISLNTVNIRDFAHNKHNKVDDYTYGGGAGMLMQAEPVYQAVSSVVSQINKCNQVHSGDNSEKNIADENILYENTSYKNTAEEIKNHNARLIYVTPQGSVFNQQMAAEFARWFLGCCTMTFRQRQSRFMVICLNTLSIHVLLSGITKRCLRYSCQAIRKRLMHGALKSLLSAQRSADRICMPGLKDLINAESFL